MPHKKPFNGHCPADESPDTEFDEESDASADEHTQNDGCVESEHSLALTDVEIKAELSKGKAQKKTLRKSKSSLKDTLSRNKRELTALISKEKTLRSEIKSVCVKARNDHSRAAIKNGFSMGIKE